MKKFYVTFGQDHRHVVNGIVFDRDCVAEISAKDYESARAQAFKILGPKWCFLYDEMPEMHYYHRGVITLS